MSGVKGKIHLVNVGKRQVYKHFNLRWNSQRPERKTYNEGEKHCDAQIYSDNMDTVKDE